MKIATVWTSGGFGRKVSFLLWASFYSAGMAAARRDVYTPPDVDALTSDAKKWYLAGVEIANRDLNSFKKVLEAGDDWKPEAKRELSILLKETIEANENTKVLVPRLQGLMDSLWGWVKEDPICFFNKMKLKATLWYIDGKRDNKSYYLLNGGGLFCKERFQAISTSTKSTDDLKDFGKRIDTLQDSILLARDELDDAAQVYVSGIKKLITLVPDVAKNAAEMRKIVEEMKKSGDERSPKILQTGDQAVQAIQDRIDNL